MDTVSRFELYDGYYWNVDLVRIIQNFPLSILKNKKKGVVSSLHLKRLGL